MKNGDSCVREIGFLVKMINHPEGPMWSLGDAWTNRVEAKLFATRHEAHAHAREWRRELDLHEQGERVKVVRVMVRTP